MNRILTAFLLTISSLQGFAQTDSIRVWNKWCAQKDTCLLFATANNTVMIYSPTLKPADIKLKSLGWGLRIGTPEVKGDTTMVMAMPYPAKSKSIKMAILSSKTGKVLKTVTFGTDTIPPLMARVGTIMGTEANKKGILSQVMLRAFFPNSLYSYPYKVKQYVFKIATDKGSATIPVNGFFLPQEVLAQISAAPSGTVLEFTAIKATCPECDTRTVADIKLKIR